MQGRERAAIRADAIPQRGLPASARNHALLAARQGAFLPTPPRRPTASAASGAKVPTERELQPSAATGGAEQWQQRHRASIKIHIVYVITVRLGPYFGERVFRPRAGYQRSPRRSTGATGYWAAIGRMRVWRQPARGFASELPRPSARFSLNEELCVGIDPQRAFSLAMIYALVPTWCRHVAVSQGSAVNQVIESIGWGGRIRTSVWRNQNPLPYRLATPQSAAGPEGPGGKRGGP
jgi:hypothetical protein